MADGKEKLKSHLSEAPAPADPSMLNAAVNYVEETASEVGNAITTLAGQVKDKARGYASVAGDAVVRATDEAREWAGAASDSAQDLGKEATRLIRRYPVHSLLVGVGIGFLVGKLNAPHKPSHR